jgi:uncharacterized peroxidase-related enzyme
MPEFPTHTPETAPEASRPALAELKAKRGFVPNLHARLAEAPAALQAYTGLVALVAASSLTAAEQQVVYMTANVIHECEYCTAGHSALARNAGLDEAAIEALREGGPLADPRLQALRAFTAAVVLERGRVQPGELDGFLAAGFTRAQVLEVLVAVAAKTISNYANRIAGTPLDAFMAKTAWIAPSRRHAIAAAA